MNPTNNPKPHCTIHIDLIDVAHINLLDYLDQDKWNSIEATSTGDFIDLIGEKILSVADKHQREPLEVLQAAENALAAIRAAITGDLVLEMKSTRREPKRHVPSPAETSGDILAQIEPVPL